MVKTTLYADLLNIIDGLIEGTHEKSSTYPKPSQEEFKMAIEYITLTLGFSASFLSNKSKENQGYNIEKLQFLREEVQKRQDEKEAVWNLRKYAS